MEPEQLREPTLSELSDLTVIGNITYALRCAQRMRPRFVLKEGAVDAEKMTAYVDTALRWIDEFVKLGTGKIDHAEFLTQATGAIADFTGDDTDFAVFATHHAMRGAMLAAKAGEKCDSDTFLEIIASAYGSSRVLLANTPGWIRGQVITVLRADHAKLLELAIGNTTQRGPLLDASEAGPLGRLWQEPTPTW